MKLTIIQAKSACPHDNESYISLENYFNNTKKLEGVVLFSAHGIINTEIKNFYKGKTNFLENKLFIEKINALLLENLNKMDKSFIFITSYFHGPTNQNLSLNYQAHTIEKNKKLQTQILKTNQVETINDITFLIDEELNSPLKGSVQFILNFNKSPNFLNTKDKIRDRSKNFQNESIPYVFLNSIQALNGKLQTGGSFVLKNDNSLLEMKKYQEDTQSIEIEASMEEFNFSSSPNPSKATAKIHLSDHECEEILNMMAFNIQEFKKQNQIHKFTVALSGGLDSALVLTLLKLTTNEDDFIEAIYMPSIYSKPLSYDLSFELCQNLGIGLHTLPIKFLHSTVKNLFTQSFKEDFQGLVDENIQSRLRGALVLARSNQLGSLIINTSNKSELAVGYSTLYGDSIGAFSMLGDLYKSEVYDLANYINKKFNKVIPETIITRVPSAELREDQSDQDSLPQYETLDQVLEYIISHKYSLDEIEELGFKVDEVKKIFSLFNNSEFKRRQFCPIIKIKEFTLSSESYKPIFRYN